MAMQPKDGRAVVGYVRVSTDEQATNGLGLQAQEERVRAYASALGLPLTEVVRDDGWSGASLDRPGLRSILERIEAGEVGVVVVAKIDRLSRSLRNLLTMLEEDFEPHRAAMVSVAEAFDTSTAAGRMFLQMLGSFAEFEKNTIVERTMGGKRQKAARGGYAGGKPPLGYRAQHGSGALVVDEDGAATVRRAFALEAEGLSRRAIAERLNAEGCTTAEGKPFTHVQVGRVLERRAFYQGGYAYAGVSAQQGAHDPIL